MLNKCLNVGFLMIRFGCDWFIGCWTFKFAYNRIYNQDSWHFPELKKKTLKVAQLLKKIFSSKLQKNKIPIQNTEICNFFSSWIHLNIKLPYRHKKKLKQIDTARHFRSNNLNFLATRRPWSRTRNKLDSSHLLIVPRFFLFKCSVVASMNP